MLPLSADGRAAFDIYAGPQDFVRLQRLGNDLDQVNPYGGFMQGLVQPFAMIVMRALLWIKKTTQLNYGWVLVLFGISIRLLLWPLNQGAMRTSIKMQRLQPELQALQKKYSDDPRKQQEAIMKVYKEHGMSPLSPLMGCLPMLLPMPVLFALYFVFQNTIEFRGVSFLWLPGHLAARSVLHHAHLHGPLHVRDVLDRDAQLAAKPAGEDDDVHDAGDAHRPLPQLRVGAQSLLRGAERRRDPAAVAPGTRARQGAGATTTVVKGAPAPAQKRRS